jgi:hypothetical protein
MSKTLQRLWPLALVALIVVAFIWWGRSAGERAAGAPVPTTTATTPAAVIKPATPAGSAAVSNPAAAAPADELADPRAALATALGYRDIGLRNREFARLLQLWIARDLEAALAYVRSMPRGAAFSEGLLLVLDAVSRRDVDRALALAAELATTRDDRNFYSAFFDRLAQENIAKATAKLALVPAGEARENATRAVASLWARTDPAAALAWAKNLPEAADRNAALESTLSELALKDPLQVIELAQKSLTSPALERTVFNALEKLNATDPVGAAGLVSLLPPGEMQVLVAVDVARAFAAQNVEAALAWTKTLPAGQTQTLALNNVLAIWARSDASAVGNYVAALPAGALQQTVAAEVAGVLAAASPQNAIGWAQALPAETRSIALARVADSWAQRDPSEASRWVAEQSAGPVAFQVLTLGYTLSYWVMKDAPAAQEFVRTLPADLQAGVATSTAPILAQLNPAGAMAWAQSLPVPAARDAALGAAFARWADNAPDAARAWLAASHLSSEQKARLLAPGK